MDFSYSAAEEQFRDEVRVWMEANVPDDLRGGRDEDLEPAQRWQRGLDWHQKLHEGGWVGLWWPEEYGGRGASLLEQAIFNEEMSRLGVSQGVNLSGISLLGPTLMHWGTEAQKQRFLPKILPAEHIWCQGYSEPGSGSDLASIQTRAVEDGDQFVVNGQKVWTSWAQYSDWCFVLVRTDPDAPKHKGISYILVDMHSPGVTVRPLVQINGDAEFNEVFFEDVRVPRENLVGDLNQGWMVAITTLMFERVSSSSFYRFEKLLPQLHEVARRVESNGRPAIEDEAVRQQLAQFSIEAEAIKYNELRRLTRQLHGQPPGPEGSFSKILASELNMRVVDFAMELLGPYAVLAKGSPFAVDQARWSYRMLSARGGTIAAGTNEILRGLIGGAGAGAAKGALGRKRLTLRSGLDEHFSRLEHSRLRAKEDAMPNGTATKMWALPNATLTVPQSLLAHGGANDLVEIPCPAYLIEHPKGLVLFDTGCHPAAADDPVGHWGPFAEALQINYPKELLLDRQIQALGYKMDDIKYVIVSHLHLDHTGYLHAFPNAKFLIMENELRYAYWPDTASAGRVRVQGYRADPQF